jgi:hypothetical protein
MPAVVFTLCLAGCRRRWHGIMPVLRLSGSEPESAISMPARLQMIQAW